MAGVRTTSGIIATGLKKWNPTRRDGSASPAAISDTDSEDVLVASTQSGLTTASTSAKTCCLTFISSKSASITKSASANAALSSDPDLEGGYRRAAVGRQPPAVKQASDLPVHVPDAGVQPRLVDVGEHDRDLEPPRE